MPAYESTGGGSEYPWIGIVVGLGVPFVCILSCLAWGIWEVGRPCSTANTDSPRLGHALAHSRKERIKPTPTATPPPSGRWVGQYWENGRSFITTYMLTFEYDGSFNGEGSDADGAFKAEGFYNATTGQVSWGEKAINGNLHVDVIGRFDQESWQSISGSYAANTGVSSTITMSFQEAVASLAPKTKPPTAVTVTTPFGPPPPSAANITYKRNTDRQLVRVQPITADQETATNGGSDTTASS